MAPPMPSSVTERMLMTLVKVPLMPKSSSPRVLIKKERDMNPRMIMVIWEIRDVIPFRILARCLILFP